MSIADLIAGKRPGLGGDASRTVATVARASDRKTGCKPTTGATVATVATVARGESTKTTLKEPIYHNNNKVTLSLSCARERKNEREATATLATLATLPPPKPGHGLSESKNEREATATLATLATLPPPKPGHGLSESKNEREATATPATVPTTGEAAGPPRAWLIRHPDGALWSHTFTPPASLSEVRALHPAALGIEPEAEVAEVSEKFSDTPAGERPPEVSLKFNDTHPKPWDTPNQAWPGDDRITCRACRRLTGARCQAAQRGELKQASRDHEPDPTRPRRCVCFAPLPHDPDQRAGAVRWGAWL